VRSEGVTVQQKKGRRFLHRGRPNGEIKVCQPGGWEWGKAGKESLRSELVTVNQIWTGAGGRRVFDASRPAVAELDVTGDRRDDNASCRRLFRKRNRQARALGTLKLPVAAPPTIEHWRQKRLAAQRGYAPRKATVNKL
jgi:hypothetical protein